MNQYERKAVLDQLRKKLLGPPPYKLISEDVRAVIVRNTELQLLFDEIDRLTLKLKENARKK